MVNSLFMVLSNFITVQLWQFVKSPFLGSFIIKPSFQSTLMSSDSLDFFEGVSRGGWQWSKHKIWTIMQGCPAALPDFKMFMACFISAKETKLVFIHKVCGEVCGAL